MGVFIEGEPPTWQNIPKVDALRIELLRSRGLTQLEHPYLLFTVSGFKHRGHVFDIDNLAKLVVDEVAASAVSVWVKMVIGDNPGVLIDDLPPPQPADPAVALRIEEPRANSVAGVVISELGGQSVLGGDEHLGLMLEFDSDTADIGRFDFVGPIKPLIDGLQPILGGPVRSPNDHRIKDLRITRGQQPGGHGVAVKLWLL